MISGRRRRYFGYPGDLSRSINTPDSAKSYASASHISPAQSQTQANNGNCSLPLQFQSNRRLALQRNFAQEYLYSSVSAQIPALLPSLKNTSHFREYQNNPMKLHRPQLEHHFDRSLYYIWLSKNDREELTNIVDEYLGSSYKKSKNLAGHRGKRMPKHSPVDYANMPRRMSVLGPLDWKNKKGISDSFPLKTIRDRFFRDHGYSPAMDALCHVHPEKEITRINEKDVQECIAAAKLLLGPYAGINTAFTTPEDIPPEVLENIMEENDADKQREIEQQEMDIAKRPFGYNSSQAKYEKKILAAMEYYNHLKSETGQLNSPPPEVLEKTGKLHRKKSKASTKNLSRKTKTRSVIEVLTNNQKNNTTKKPPSPQNNASTNPKRKFNKDNEEDLMAMYLHFLGDNEDIHIKTKVEITDVNKLRKQLHVDRSQEEENELVRIGKLIQEDSFSDLDPIAKKVIKGKFDPLRKSELSQNELNLVRNILIEQSEKVPSPKIKTRMRQVGSMIKRKSSSVEVAVPEKTSSASLLSGLLETKKEQIDNIEFEKEEGFFDKDLKEVMKTALNNPIEEEDEDDLSSDSDHSSLALEQKQNAQCYL